jgi:hypothetical protein
MEVIPQQGKPPRPIAQLPNRSWVVTNTGGSIGWTTFSTLDSTLRRGKKKLHQSEASSLGKRQMGGVLSNHRAAACLSLACAGTQPGFCSALSGPSQPKLLRRAVDPSQARPRDRVSQHVAHPPLPQPLPRPDLRHFETAHRALVAANEGRKLDLRAVDSTTHSCRHQHSTAAARHVSVTRSEAAFLDCLIGLPRAQRWQKLIR